MGFNELAEYVAEAPGLKGQPPRVDALAALVNADANINRELLEAVVPGWDIDAGVTAARQFLNVKL